MPVALGEILETITDLADLADRNLTRIFSDPWPPAKQVRTSYPGAYVRQQTYYRDTPSNARKLVHQSAPPRPRATASTYRRETPRTETRYPQSRPERQTRLDSSRRSPTNVVQQRTQRSSAINRVVPTAAPPRPVSAPSAVTSSNRADTREKRISARPIQVDARRTQSLRLDDFRPDLTQCDVLVIAVAEMEICKEIFSGWRAQLKIAEPKTTDKLEKAIISTVYKLHIGASAALRASRNLIENYKNLLGTIERNLEHISRSRTGGSIFSSEISALAPSISAHSRALSSYVKQMQDRLRSLVRDIEKTKESADKRALKRKIWRWLARVFQVLSALISTGGAIFSLFNPVGVVESVAIGGASFLSGAAARLCEMVKDKYNETTFDEILTFLRNHVPESAKAAEIALTSFRACHRILQVELEVRKGQRHDWVSASEARRSRGQWTRAEQRLQSFRDEKR